MSKNKVQFQKDTAWSISSKITAMNMNVVKGFQSAEITRWAKQHLESGSLVYSDGLACFSAVLSSACHYYTIVTGGGPQSVIREEFAWVNTMISNVKRAINGTYHAINPNHLPRFGRVLLSL